MKLLALSTTPQLYSRPYDTQPQFSSLNEFSGEPHTPRVFPNSFQFHPLAAPAPAPAPAPTPLHEAMPSMGGQQPPLKKHKAKVSQKDGKKVTKHEFFN